MFKISNINSLIKTITLNKMFTAIHNIKAVSDLNQNILIYKSIDPQNPGNRESLFQVSKVINKAHDSLTSILSLFKSQNGENTFLLSGSYDKAIKLWDITGEPKLLDTLKHPKKVDFGIFDAESAKLTYSDKTGDIYETTIVDLKLTPFKMTQSNMNTLTLFDKFHFGTEKEFLVFADDYHNVKICKYPEIYHITNIFSPYKDRAFHKILDLAPHGIIVLFSDGTVEIVSLKSLETNEYTSQKIDLASKIESKKIFDLAKIDNEQFIAVDDYYTVAVLLKIKEGQLVEEKVVNLSDNKVLSDVKDYYSPRFIEAYRVENKIDIYYKYENAQGADIKAEDDLYKLNETVFIKRVTIDL